MPRKNPKPKDPTSASRSAALKERLLAEGGKRLNMNLDGTRTKKLDQLVKIGVGDTHSDVVRRLIDDADYA